MGSGGGQHCLHYTGSLPWQETKFQGCVPTDILEKIICKRWGLLPHEEIATWLVPCSHPDLCLPYPLAFCLAEEFYSPFKAWLRHGPSICLYDLFSFHRGPKKFHLFLYSRASRMTSAYPFAFSSNWEQPGEPIRYLCSPHRELSVTQRSARFTLCFLHGTFSLWNNQSFFSF